MSGPREVPSNRPADSTRPSDAIGTPAELSAGGPRHSAGDLANRRLGDFLLLRRIGAGGMGEVYLGQQVSLKRQVAIKVLRREAVADDTARRRFAVEAEAAAKLTHSNIVQIYASGEQDGIHYMALEYVQGMNLRDYVARKGPVSATFASRVMEQVAAALHHAAEAGIVHRDIKPDNILLTRKGELKVADFGLARLRIDKPANLTQPGITMGTPLYMSPEQVEGRAFDPRSDLYSFGATCYFMLVGQPPYRGETSLAIALQHIRSEPESLSGIRPDLPRELCRIVHKLMAKNPDERYQTGRQVVRDLQKLRGELSSEQVASSRPVKSPPSVPVDIAAQAVAKSRVRTFSRDFIRRYAAWWLAASAVLALLAGAGYGWYCRAPDLRIPDSGVPVASPPPRWEDIPHKESAEAQYRFATWAGQDVHAEAAWLAVINYWDSEPDWAFVARMELGKHYLMERRLDKADTLFSEMAGALDDRTRLAGEVGKSMVLSFRDRPGESQSSLWEQVRDSGFALDRKAPGGAGALGDRTLLSMVLWTFERNYRDLGRDWDEDVRRWANRRIQRVRSTASPRAGEQPAVPSRSPNGQRDRS